MEKVKIQLAKAKDLPFDLDVKKILKWSSEIFELEPEIVDLELPTKSKGKIWEYTDPQLEEVIPSPNKKSKGFTFAILNVRVDLNWYTRRLKKKRVAFTFYFIKEKLDQANIPAENLVLRLLYSISFIYLSHKNSFPPAEREVEFLHDETKGCLFDMTPEKVEVVESCHKPIICDRCTEFLINNGVEKEKIKQAKKEILKIKKDLYYQLAHWVKAHPIWAIFISSFYALILGLVGSLLFEIFK